MSPEVWSDVKPRLQAIATQHGVRVEWPNEALTGTDNIVATWVSIETGAESAGRIELGRDVWEEFGAVFIHVMVPAGSGIEDALALRKAFSVAFRGITPNTIGLNYRDQSFDPLGPSYGVYRHLSLTVRYEFTDILS